jgi:acyl-CoA reductase-like NAD-dependent aldehyde dehydrogenase
VLGRIPPVLLALGAALVLVVGVVVFAVASGGTSTPKGVRTCDPALQAGAYQCVTFASVSGTGPAGQQAWLRRGGLTFALTKQDGVDRITFSGGCNTTEAPVAVTTTRFRIGTPALSGQKACPVSKGAHDDWAAALLTGTVGAVEQSDATLVVSIGDRRVVFDEVLAPKP